MQIEAEKHTPARLQKLSEIMVRSNKAAKDASDKLVGNRKYHQFRAALRGEEVDGLTPEEIETIGRIGKKRKATMLEVEAIRNEVIEGFIPAMVQFANRYARFYSGHDADDLFGEITIFMVKIVYGYLKPRQKFITYLYCSLHSELSRYVLTHRSHGLTSKSGHFLELLRMTICAIEHLEHQEQHPDYYAVLEYLRPRYKENKTLKKIKRLEDYLPGVWGFVVSASAQEEILHRHFPGAGLDDYTATTADKSRLYDQKSLQIDLDEAAEQIIHKAPMQQSKRNAFLRKLAGASNEQIATDLGLSIKTVRTYIKDARSKIRQSLALADAA